MLINTDITLHFPLCAPHFTCRPRTQLLRPSVLYIRANMSRLAETLMREN